MIASIRNFLKQYITSKALRNLILVYLLFTVLVNVLRDSIQGVENSLLMLIIGIGLIFGWLLAISKISDWMMWLIAVLSGGTVLTIRVGRLGPLLSSMFLQYIDLVRQNIQWLFNQVPPSRSSTIYLDIAELGSRLATLGSRLGFWIQSLFRGRPIFDPVATAFIWGILIWLIAIWMIWMTVRIQRPLVGIIPIMTLTGLSLVYTEKSVYNLIPMLGFMVGLVVMVRYDVHEDQWKLENIKYAGIIRERMMVFSITLAIGLMVFASFSPSISIESIVDFINRITSDTKDDDLARSLGLEPPKRPGNVNVLDSKRVGGLPNQHLVNSGEELSDQIVMIIQVEGFSDSNADSLPPKDQVYYWRSLTYDQYTGRGWVSRSSVDQKYKPGEKTISNWPDNYQVIRQHVEYIEDLNGLLFTTGIPLSTNQPFQVAWRVQSEDQLTFDIFGASLSETEYTADSLQPIASSVELQEAGQNYPDWIRNRYIGLPEFVPEEVITLARDITATEPTPYDRALAIETFLRRFPYTLDLPHPPQDRDIVDYFLFGAMRGYCDYYASAMVVLSRAAGLPARFVTGYIGGYYDENINAYLITADLAHAWAEVYFPGYGWIVFEPTGGRPEIDRPDNPIPIFAQDYASSFDPLAPEKPGIGIKWWLILLVSPIIISIILFIILLIDEVILFNLPLEKQLNRIYRRIYKYARWCGFVSLSGDTGFEFSRKFIHFLNQYGNRSRAEEWLTLAADQLRELTRVYYLVNFSLVGNTSVNPRETVLTFRKLRTRLWYLWLLAHAHPYMILRFILWDTAPMIISTAPKQS